MDYLNERSRLESDISGIAMAAALTNTGANITHRDFEYRYSKLFPETQGEGYLEMQRDYSNAPQWNTESLQAQQAHEHILYMARPVLDSPPADVSIPPQSVRDQQLHKLRQTRDQMHAMYNQQLKPIWSKVLDYWSEPPGGTT